jgi:hypothetical protein
MGTQIRSCQVGWTGSLIQRGEKALQLFDMCGLHAARRTGLIQKLKAFMPEADDYS